MHQVRNAPLATMTTLGLGGPAARLVDIHTEQELKAVLDDAASAHEPVVVLGGGSNVIIDDAGWPGLVLRPALRGIEKEPGGNCVKVRAGEVWDDLVATCIEEGWVGLTSLSGIPGWAGAAPIQNIGAYGYEVGESLLQVRVYDRLKHDFTTLPNHACRFGYRSSLFRGDDRYVVLQLTLSLGSGREEIVRYPELATTLGVKTGERAPSNRIREAVMELRRGKGMVVDGDDPESRSAGSFFVNPVVSPEVMKQVEQRAVRLGIVNQAAQVPRYEVKEGFKIPAAWLIEAAGFKKGMTKAGIGISSKHSLALVNRGGTTQALLQFEQEIRESVRDRLGVDLSREPVFVGAKQAIPSDFPKETPPPR